MVNSERWEGIMSKRILVVDDSQFIYEEIKYLLSDTDYEIVGHAKNGADAFRMYGELMPDIVTMDILMPGLSGIETSQLILGKWKDAKIAIVSSLAYDDVLEEAAALGIHHFIYKPFDKEDIVEALDALIAK